MPKGLKIALILIVPLALIVGAAYGLAKIHLIPLPNNPALRPVFKAMGLAPKAIPPKTKMADAAAPDPLAAQKKALEAERTQLADERAALKDESASQAKGEAYTAAQNTLDPKSVARMAAVYEQMPVDKLTKIFSLLPDAQVLALLRGMDEKKVAEILAALAPGRAARFTLALSRPVPPRTASTTTP